MRAHARVFLAVAALGALFVTAAAALAAETYLPDGSFSGPGADPGRLSDPKRAAVEQSTGNLFVADEGNGHIDVFNSNGDFLTFFGEAELEDPFGIAIAEGGGQTVVYVSDGTVGKVQRFDSDEAPIPIFTLDGTYSGPASGVGEYAAPLALAPNGDLWLADKSDDNLERYTPTGAFVSSIDGSSSPGGPFAGLLDLAVDSQGRVYAVDADGTIENQPDGFFADGQSRVERFAPDGTHQLSLADLSRPATVAVNPATDEVAVSDDQTAVDANNPPRLRVFDDAGAELYSTRMGSTATYTTVHGLAFESATPRIWSVNDAGLYESTPYGEEGIHRFALVEPIAPEVTVDPASAVEYTTAQVTGTVDANGAGPAFDASCRFDYVTQAHFEAEGFENAPSAGCDVNPVSGEDPTAVGAVLAGLQHSTTYHVRLVATNLGGTDTAVAAATFTTFAVGPPAAVLDPATAISEESAAFDGTVNPNAPDENANLSDNAKEVFATTYRFECTPGCPATPEPQTIAADDQALPVSFDPRDLEPNTQYTVRLIATNSMSGESVAEQSFQTPAVAPTVETMGSFDRTTTTAILRGRVNPRNTATTYRFEWGTEPGEYPNVVSGDGGSDNRFHEVSKEITGLELDTTYHYRLVAEGAGTASDEESSITTRDGLSECPDASEAVKARGCRALELVSTANKNANPATGAAITEDGNRALIETNGGIPGGSSGSLSFATAQRTASGWQVTPIAPDRTEIPAGGIALVDADPGFRNFVFSASGSLGSAVARNSLIRVGESGEASFLHKFAVGAPESPINRVASADLSRVIASRDFNGFNSGLYDYAQSPPELISVLPDGEPAPCYVLSGESGTSTKGQRWVSADGERVYFITKHDWGCSSVTAEGPNKLLVREGDTTEWVSEPPSGEEDRGAVFIQASASGEQVIFITATNMIPADDDDQADLYRYDAGTAAAACLTCSTPNAAVINAIASQDLSHVYFSSRASLVPGKSQVGEANLYVWTEAGIRFVGGPLAAGPLVNPGPSAGPGEAAISPDGNVLVFRATGNVTAYDAAGTLQYYLYDDRARTIACISCADETPASASDWLLANSPFNIARESPLSDDGRRFVFSSSRSFVANDVDGYPDLYEWHDGRYSLITAGARNANPTTRPTVVDLTSDGRSFLFIAAGRLVRGTPDDAANVYVARLGGGFPTPPTPPAPCAGDACRAAPAAPPPASVPATPRFSGPGNVKPRCGKGKVRRNGRCVRKKARKRGGKSTGAKHKPKSGKQANGNRGTSK